MCVYIYIYIHVCTYPGNNDNTTTNNTSSSSLRGLRQALLHRLAPRELRLLGPDGAPRVVYNHIL